MAKLINPHVRTRVEREADIKKCSSPAMPFDVEAFELRILIKFVGKEMSI